MTQSVFLKVSSAFLLGGAIVKTGDIIEVSEGEAKALLHCGKATLIRVDAAPEQPPEDAQQRTSEKPARPANDEQTLTKPAGQSAGQTKEK